jgi:hypothetical protein
VDLPSTYSPEEISKYLKKQNKNHAHIVIAIFISSSRWKGYSQSHRQSIKHKAYQTRSPSHSRELAQAIGDQTSKDPLKRKKMKKHAEKKG